MTDAFVKKIEDFVAREGVDLITFEKRQRKGEITQSYLRRRHNADGVVSVGKAQERVRVMRTVRRRSNHTGATYPWIVDSTAMDNHYYFGSSWNCVGEYSADRGRNTI